MLGETLREARHQKRWSIEQLSKRSGVPGRFIREMEGGSVTYVPSEGNTVLLAEDLTVAVGPLLEQRDQAIERWQH